MYPTTRITDFKTTHEDSNTLCDPPFSVSALEVGRGRWQPVISEKDDDDDDDDDDDEVPEPSSLLSPSE